MTETSPINSRKASCRREERSSTPAVATGEFKHQVIKLAMDLGGKLTFVARQVDNAVPQPSQGLTTRGCLSSSPNKSQVGWATPVVGWVYSPTAPRPRALRGGSGVLERPQDHGILARSCQPRLPGSDASGGGRHSPAERAMASMPVGAWGVHRHWQHQSGS
jgi:hypothetical protein